MSNKICFFEIPAKQLDEARQFYQQLFSWRFSAVKGRDDYLFIQPSEDTPDAVGGAIATRAAGERGGTTVFVQVDSLDDTVQKVIELGGKLVEAKMAVGDLGWAATVEDPQGNLLGLVEMAADT